MKAPVLFFILLSIASQLWAQTDQHINTKKGLAIEGYDPVAYIESNKAIEGNPSFKAKYKGAVYYFSSEVNKSKFLKAANKYVPQYGGWCAYAMGDTGKKVSVDPETFKVINGKTYLFYNRFMTNTLNSWNEDEANLKPKADNNWKRITSR